MFKIKKWLGKFRIFKKIRFLESKIKAYQEENYNLKGMLMMKRKTITELKDNLVKTVNDLNLLGEKLDTVEVKKKKAEILISQLVKRRDEFIKRIESKTYIDINSMADYKFFLSEPFIKDHYDPYNPKIDDVDRPSIIKGLGKVLDEMELKKTDDELSQKNLSD